MPILGNFSGRYFSFKLKGTKFGGIILNIRYYNNAAIIINKKKGKLR